MSRFVAHSQVYSSKQPNAQIPAKISPGVLMLTLSCVSRVLLSLDSNCYKYAQKNCHDVGENDKAFPFREVSSFKECSYVPPQSVLFTFKIRY